MHRVDAAAIVPRAAVGQVVAVDDRDHDIVEPQPLDRVGQPLRLVRVRRRRRLERLDRAEPAARACSSAPAIMNVAVPWAQQS